MNDHQQLVAALREVLRDDSVDAPLLIKRVPFICEDIKGINKAIGDINDKLDNKFVSKESFLPVKTLVYGFVGLMLTGLMVAIIGMVLKTSSI